VPLRDRTTLAMLDAAGGVAALDLSIERLAIEAHKVAA
jgi:hypothetical protein